MSILDNKLKFSDQQAITAAAASTNVLDMGAARDLGTGTPLYVCLNVDETFDDTGDNTTYEVKLQTDDDEAFGSATDAQVLFTLAANLAAGSKKCMPLAPGLVNERYLRLYFTPTNGDASAGKVTAFLTDSYEVYRAFADNIPTI